MKEKMRDPYRNWKVTAMVLATIVTCSSIVLIFIPGNLAMVFAVLVLGAMMCGVSGMMALVKGRRFLGYLCSVFVALFLVVLLVWIVRMFW